MKNALIILMIGLIPFSFSSCDNTDTQANAVGTKMEKKETKPENPAEATLKISTTYGDMVVKLYNETPKHRDNFLKLAKEGFYDSLIFHRVIQGFMIQGGDPQSKNPLPDTSYGNGGPGYTIPAEIRPGLYHKKGAMAAARLSDDFNPARNSSGSQFYIVQGRIFDLNDLMGYAKQSGVNLSNKHYPYSLYLYTPRTKLVEFFF